MANATFSLTKERHKLVLVFLLTPAGELGVFVDEDGDKFGDAGETVLFTAAFRSTGNVRVKNATVSHSLKNATLVCDSDFRAAISVNVRYHRLFRLFA